MFRRHQHSTALTLNICRGSPRGCQPVELSYFEGFYFCMGSAAQAFTLWQASTASAITGTLWSHLAQWLPTIARTVEVVRLARDATTASVTPRWHVHATSGDAAYCHPPCLFIACTFLGGNRLTTQHAIHRISDIGVDDELLPALLLDDYIEGRGCLALLDAFL